MLVPIFAAFMAFLLGAYLSAHYYRRVYDRSIMRSDLQSLRFAYSAHRAIVEDKLPLACRLLEIDFHSSLTTYRGYYDFSPCSISNEAVVVEAMAWYGTLKTNRLEKSEKDSGTACQ